MDKPIWPTLTLSKYYDTPDHLKERKIDPFTAFEDAGVKLICNPRDSIKVRLQLNVQYETKYCDMS